MFEDGKAVNMKVLTKRGIGAAALVVAAVLLLVWTAGVFADVWGLGKGDEVMVNIPAGSGLHAISEILDESGIISHPFIFRMTERGKERMYRQGGHLLDKSMSYAEIAEKLTRAPELEPNIAVKVLIPEGYELRNIADTLEEKGLINRGVFEREIEKGDFDYGFVKDIKRKENRLEGYLFPATYEFIPGTSEYDIIDTMLKKFADTAVPIYEESGSERSLDQIVTMASMVEREAANDSERGKVASVFYNRLERDMTLSSCATVQYILKERKEVLSNSDIKIKSDYNTYINKGLPAGPIASPGEKSVRAALYPDKTDYLYFAARSDGSENVFSKTGEEHLQTVEKLQGK